jgi:hypothetical protein
MSFLPALMAEAQGQLLAVEHGEDIRQRFMFTGGETVFVVQSLKGFEIVDPVIVGRGRVAGAALNCGWQTMSSFGNVVVVVVVVVGLEPEIDQSGLHGDRRGVWLRWVRAGGDWEDEGLAWDCVRMVMRWEVRSTRYSDICQSD